MGTRLNSWKEIATYLGYDESTARRWEKRGLPIHRIGGSKGASVYAYPEEIDHWMIDNSRIGTEAESETNVAVDSQTLYRAEPIPERPSLPEQRSVVVNSPKFSWWSRNIRYGIAVLILIIVVLVRWSGLRSDAPRTAESYQGEHQNSANRLILFSGTPAETSAEIQEQRIFQLKQVVKDAQVWEMLTLYVAPWDCDAHAIPPYWESGSKAFINLGESVSRLNERGWHYGFDSKLLDFEFRYVKISPDGQSAGVGTREHWWLPLYSRNEVPVQTRNPDQGPYEVDYQLVKRNDNWYLSSTNTPYAPWKPKKITCKNWSNSP